MKQLILKNKIMILGILIFLSLVSVYFYYQKTDETVTNNRPLPSLNEKVNDNQTEDNKQPSKIFIDVKGAVKNPGVYEVEENERVLDIIQKAGGFQKQADQRQVNLAEKVQDEMVIYVPKEGEVVETGANSNDSIQKQSPDKVNINSATLEQLQTISGIGPSKATAIIEYRKKNGDFKKIEDLKNVTGIGDKTFEKLKDSISVH